MQLVQTMKNQFLQIVICFFCVTILQIQSAESQMQSYKLSDSEKLCLQLFLKDFYAYLDANSAIALSSTCKTLVKAPQPNHRFSWILEQNKPLTFIDNPNGEQTCEALEIVPASFICNSDRTHVAYLLYNPGGRKSFQSLMVGYSPIAMQGNQTIIRRKTENFIEYHSLVHYINVPHGYLDKKKNAFLFLSGASEDQPELSRFMWPNHKPIIEHCGRINFGQPIINPWSPPKYKDYNHFSISNIQENTRSNYATITFKNNYSIVIDTNTHTIIEQKKPFTILPTTDKQIKTEGRLKLIQLIDLQKQLCTTYKTENWATEIYLPSIVLDHKTNQFVASGFTHSRNQTLIRYRVQGDINITDDNKLVFSIEKPERGNDYLFYGQLEQFKNNLHLGIGDSNKNYFIFLNLERHYPVLRTLVYHNSPTSENYNYIDIPYLDIYDMRENVLDLSVTQDGPVTKQTITWNYYPNDQDKSKYTTCISTITIDSQNQTLTTNESAFSEKKIAKERGGGGDSYSSPYQYLYRARQKSHTNSFKPIMPPEPIPWVPIMTTIGSSLKFLTSFVQIASHGPLLIPSLISDYLSAVRCSQYARKKSPTLDKWCFGGSLYSLVFLSAIIRKNPLLYAVHGLVDLLQIYTSAKRLKWL